MFVTSAVTELTMKRTVSPAVERWTQMNSVWTSVNDAHEDLVPIDHMTVLQEHGEFSEEKNIQQPFEDAAHYEVKQVRRIKFLMASKGQSRSQIKVKH